MRLLFINFIKVISSRSLSSKSLSMSLLLLLLLSLIVNFSFNEIFASADDHTSGQDTNANNDKRNMTEQDTLDLDENENATLFANQGIKIKNYKNIITLHNLKHFIVFIHTPRIMWYKKWTKFWIDCWRL